MQTQLEQRYGADNTIYDVDEKAKLPSSSFDFSRKNITTIDIGMYMPIDWFRVFPGDKVRLGNRFLLETLPLASPPLTNYRVRIHWFYIKMSSLWKGWQSFISQGRKGSVSVKKIPTISEDSLKGALLPSSLAVALNLPACEYSGYGDFPQYTPNVTDMSLIDSIPNRHLPKDGVNVLPFLFYQKAFRFDVAPYNLLQDNEVWLPEDLSEEWRLDYEASNFDGRYFVPQGEVPAITDSNRPDNVPSVDDVAVDLAQLRYACYENDYFTTAKPWLVRGDEVSSASMSIDVDDLSFDSSDIFSYMSDIGVANGSNLVSSALGVTGVVGHSDFDIGFLKLISNASDFNVSTVLNDMSLPNREATIQAYIKAFNRLKVSSSSSISASLTANKLREMLAFSVWQERNALTNGNYNEFIKAHYMRNPKSPDYEPYYLGGLTQQVNFSQILQTSASQSESPLGSQASLGSSSGQGQVFDFDFDDFGYVMGIMFVTPEVYYTQGVGHEWTDVLPEDQFVPEFAQTGYEPVLNQEIFPQGTNDDLQLYGYQTRNAYLKARQNRASGLMSLPSSIDKLFGSYVQAREFSELPKLSVQMVSMSPKNVRRDFLAYTNYPAFKLQIASDVRLIRNLPYRSTPNTFGF